MCAALYERVGIAMPQSNLRMATAGKTNRPSERKLRHPSHISLREFK